MSHFGHAFTKPHGCLTQGCSLYSLKQQANITFIEMSISHKSFNFCEIPAVRLCVCNSTSMQTGLRNWESAGERAGAAAPSKSSTGRTSSNIDSLSWTTVVDCQLLNLDTHTHTHTHTQMIVHIQNDRKNTEICTQLCPYSSVRCDFYLSVSGDFGNFGKRSSERSRVSVSVDFQASALLLLPPQHP